MGKTQAVNQASLEGKPGANITAGKATVFGHKPPGRFAVYYRRSGDIAAVVPGGPDRVWEQGLEHAVDPMRAESDRIYLTYTDDAVLPDTHRIAYRRGDKAVTPAPRIARQRWRAAERRGRSAMYRSNRHPRSALRAARATFRTALAAWRHDLVSKREQGHPWRLEDATKTALLRRFAQKRLVRRLLRLSKPSPALWRKLKRQGTPPAEMFFTSLDYVPTVNFTKRQLRLLAAFGFASEFTRFTNSPEGAKYREQVIAAQSRGELMPVVEIPIECREGGIHQDQRWLRRYDLSALMRKGRMRLCHCRCGYYFFARNGAPPRCPSHDPMSEVVRKILRANRRKAVRRTEDPQTRRCSY